VCTWHSLQVAAVAPRCDLLEIQFEESPLYEQVLPDPRLLAQDGSLKLTLTPAPGPELKRELLAKHPFQPVPMGIESQMNR
jgi:galactonate dehydratase